MSLFDVHNFAESTHKESPAQPTLKTTKVGLETLGYCDAEEVKAATENAGGQVTEREA